jgi:hypothetical protein
MMIRSHRFPRLWISLLALIAFSRSIASATPSADGWRKLWQNRNAEARSLFRQALKQNPGDTMALRGIGALNDEDGDSVASLQARRALYRVSPNHWSVAAGWPRMVELAWETGRWALLDGAAGDLVASPGAAPELRASAQLALAEADDRAGRSAEAARRWATMGFVTKWRVIGPFENVSLSGFDKPLPPEHELDLKKSYAGKDARPLRWHPLPLVGRDGQCAVGECLGDEDANVYFMATALYSPREQPVHVCCDPTGASKLFVNGHLLYADEVYRMHFALVADPLRVGTTLHKGWNTVLVKLADDEQLRAVYSMRLTAAGGNDVLHLPVDPDHVDRSAVPSDSSPVPAPIEPTLITLNSPAAVMRQAW